MSKETTDSQVSTTRLIGGKVPDSYKAEHLTTSEAIAEMLYRAQNVTDEYFDELVDSLGYRAAKLVLRAKAVSGDVKALDLYLRHVKESRAERAKRDKAPDRNVTPQVFVQTTRDETPISSESSETGDET